MMFKKSCFGGRRFDLLRQAAPGSQPLPYSAVEAEILGLKVLVRRLAYAAKLLSNCLAEMKGADQ
jgi:hypothetical protein